MNLQNEIYQCLSSLIYTLGQDLKPDSETYAEVMEMQTSIPDYEEAARDQGWERQEDGTITHEDHNPQDTWEGACDESGSDPYEVEVYEHWSVSNYLARKLMERGQKVVEFCNMNVWCRTTTGQSIEMDYVIEQIIKETSA